jgi:perosamine synthetase
MNKYYYLYFTSLNLKKSFYLLYLSFLDFFGNKKIFHKYKFLNSFKNKFETNSNLFLTQSGRSGLYLILKSLNIKENDEVVLTGFTCSAVSEAIILLNAKPKYVDINPKNFKLCYNSFLENVNSNTKAIIIQHTFGLSGLDEKIYNYAKINNIYLIEDCALSIGGKHEDKYFGNFGDASYFSFELSKTISVGWGGLVIINNEKILHPFLNVYKNLNNLNNFETSRRLLQAAILGILYTPLFMKYQIKLIAIFYKIKLFKPSAIQIVKNILPTNYNSLPSDRQWRGLFYIFSNFNTIFEIRKSRTLALNNIFSNIINIDTIYDNLNNLCLVRFPILVKDKEHCIGYFDSLGFEIGSWFSKPISSNSLNNDFQYVSGSCINSEMICKYIINIPINEKISEKDFDFFLLKLKEYFSDPNQLNFLSKIYKSK